MKNKYFKSGEEYTLADFFSKNNKIIIPDLQRDYCWGNTRNNEDSLVTQFMSSLIDLFLNNPSEPFTLGLIYGYELDNKGLKGHTHLCDGQQRITTLFLLLGILNRKTNGKFQHRLISDFELHEDGKEPYLQYAIRESTLYFLSDLVCEFFLKNSIKEVEEIEKEDWFFDDYKLDASITSMLKALNQIEVKLTEIEDLTAFGKFVCESLQLLYYDMGNRAQGEETFVIINKTGEPLTSTENLKPKYINQLQSEEEQKQTSKWWEEWENFFWLNRNKNDTADKGFEEFLRWVVLLNSDADTFEEVRKGQSINFNHLKNCDIQATEIKAYFEVVKFIFTDSIILSNNRSWLAPSEINSQIVWLRILPVIEYVKRFGKDNIRNIIRVKQFFKNRAKDDDVSKDIANMLPQSIRIIKDLPSTDIADIISKQGISKNLLTDEEQLKFTLYKSSDNREEIEDALWKEEEHKIWNGEIAPILEWSGDSDFNFALYKKYSTIFSTLFYDEMDQPELDILRRALLTRELKEYPKIFSGNTNYSFCWEYSDWKTLIHENSDKFKELFDELFDKSKEEVYETIRVIIDKNLIDKDYDEFVKMRELLEYCSQKNIQWDGNKGWILIKGKARHGAHMNLKSYRLFLDLSNTDSLKTNGWTIDIYEYEGGCVVFKNAEKDIVIDSFFVQEKDKINLYQLNISKRAKKDKTFDELANIAQKNELKFNKNSQRYESNLTDYSSIVGLINTLISSEVDDSHEPL